MKREFDRNLENDTKYMIKKLEEFYGFYFKASHRLRTNQIFALQAIYECITQVGNDNTKDGDHQTQVIKDFAKDVKKESGINFNLSLKDGLRVEVKSKRKRISSYKYI